MIKVFLIIAVIIQTVATVYALRLVRATKYNAVWILFIIGFSLLSVERIMQVMVVNGGVGIPHDTFSWLGVVISICMSIGVMYAHKLIRYIDRLNRQRQLMQKRILTAVLRTEEKSRSQFSKELHDGLGPLLSSAKMSLTALSREERTPAQREIIDNTTYVIDEAIRSLREISNNLSPQVLNDFGLARGIQNFAQRGAAQRAHPLHDQPARGTVRHRHRGDPLPRGVRTDKQLAQTLGLQRDQPVALVGRRHADARLLGQRLRLQPRGGDGLRHGAFEHRFARPLHQRALQRRGSQGQGDARRHPRQRTGRSLRRSRCETPHRRTPQKKTLNGEHGKNV